ncbi:MAG: RNA-binding protein [Xanthobacteraceae bacterium]
MPKGPKGEKRPADVIGTAIMVAKIATGEIADNLPLESAASEFGRKGGKARAKKLSAKKRREIAKKAADKRWQK